MKQRAWAKTLLSTYTCLENITNAIDKYVVSQGIYSGRNNLTTLESAERIISLTQRKKLMINLKVLIEKTISALDVDVARILIMKYFDKVKPEICAEILNFSRRTFFRKLDKAILSFANQLKLFGYDEHTLYMMFCKEGWIIELYENFLKQKQKDVSIEQNVENKVNINDALNLKNCVAY